MPGDGCVRRERGNVLMYNIRPWAYISGQWHMLFFWVFILKHHFIQGALQDNLTSGAMQLLILTQAPYFSTDLGKYFVYYAT